MKVCRVLFAISACLAPFSVFAAASPLAIPSESLDSWIEDILRLSENLDSELRERVQKSAKEAVQKIAATDDIVLQTVWIELLKFGSTLQANFRAWQHLEGFGYEQHVDGEALRVDDVAARRALSEALFECLSLELQVQKQVAGILEAFEAAVRQQAASSDRRKVEAKYGQMRKFLMELLKYMGKLQGQTELIHKMRILEASVSQGDMAAKSVLGRVNEQHQQFHDSLEKQFAEVLGAARKCQESGLLLDDVVDFMLALNEL